jgi:hypothetical protein
VSVVVVGVCCWCRVPHPIHGPHYKDILSAKPYMTSTWKHPRTGQHVLIQGKHWLFADLANRELSDSSKKFRFTRKPCKDVKFKLSIQSEITLILASSYKI